jgi:hypothetical protein
MQHTNVRWKREGQQAAVVVGRVMPATLRYHPRHQDCLR